MVQPSFFDEFGALFNALSSEMRSTCPTEAPLRIWGRKEYVDFRRRVRDFDRSPYSTVLAVTGPRPDDDCWQHTAGLRRLPLGARAHPLPIAANEPAPIMGPEGGENDEATRDQR